MCGILGIVDPEGAVAPNLYLGGMALQHRGQDSAGLATFGKRFCRQAGLGLLSDVLRERNLDSFEGNLGLAHLRYATAGAGSEEECQPFLLSYPFGLALVHNGNLTNDASLRRRLKKNCRNVNSSSDSETILQVFAGALAQEDLADTSVEAVMRATRHTMDALEGAYSVIILIANRGLLVFRDPHGFRPLVMGKKNRAIVFASESVALDAMEASLDRDVAPGEAVFVDLEGRRHCRQLFPPRPSHCAFEYIYLARPESTIDGKSVSTVREALGVALAERYEDKAEVVFDVPSSAEDIAVAFAQAAGIPYRKGIRNNHYCHRSFIAANPALRRNIVGVKFLFERSAIKGKKVVVIDDSIVRGTTSRLLVAKLRTQGARKIHFLSAAPPVMHPCVYGIDMAVRRDLIAASLPPEVLVDYLGVDRLQFQTLEDLEKAVGGKESCLACFNGCYPTDIGAEALARIEENRSAKNGTEKG